MLTSTFRACSRSAPSVCPRTWSTRATPTLRRRPRNWWSCWWEGTASVGRVQMACRRRWNRLHPPPAWPQVRGLLSGDQFEPGISLFQSKEDVGATRELQTSKRRNNICVYQVKCFFVPVEGSCGCHTRITNIQRKKQYLHVSSQVLLYSSQFML